MAIVYIGILVVGLSLVVCLVIMEIQRSKKVPLNIAPAKPDELMGLEKEEYSIAAPVRQPVPAPVSTPRAEKPPQNKTLEESQALLEENLTKSAELEELQDKHKKLEKLFEEKSRDLEKTAKDLDTELKTRKEFNKVKDLLEKEIKDLRDKNHKLDLEISAAKADAENFKKRAQQLDEKIGAKDKEITEKEKKIEEVTKRMQTFATPTGQPKEAPPTLETAKQKIDIEPPAAADIIQPELKLAPEPSPEAQTPEPAGIEEEKPHLNLSLLGTPPVLPENNPLQTSAPDVKEPDQNAGPQESQTAQPASSEPEKKTEEKPQ